MLAVLYSLLFLSGGLFIAKFQFSDKNRVERLWLGLSVGILLEMCLPAIFAFFFRFSLIAHFLAAFAMMGIVLVSYLYRMKGIFEESIRENKKILAAVFAVCIPLVLLTGYLQYTHCVMPAQDGSYWCGQSTYGDLCMHLSFVTSLRDAAFPPSYNLLFNTEMSYPFLTDSLSTTFLLFGCPLNLALVIPGTFLMFLVYLGMAVLTYRVVGSRTSVIIVACLFFFLNGGLGFIYDLDMAWRDGFVKFREIFEGYYKTPANQPDLNLRFSNVIADLMIPQRSLMGGWAMGIPVLYLVVDTFRNCSRRRTLILGIWAATLPMIHTHTFLAVGLFSGGFILCHLIFDEHRKQVLFHAFLYLLIVVVLAVPQLWDHAFKQTVEGGSLRFQFNWVNNSGGRGFIDFYSWFWIKNVGIPVILLVCAILDCKRRGRLDIVFGMTAIFLIGETIIFQPNEYDNNKLFYIWFMFASILAADYGYVLMKRMEGLKGRWLISTLVVLVSVTSGVLSISRECVSSYQLFSSDAVKAGQWIDQNTEKNAVFMTGQQHINPVCSLAGRQIICGSDLYVYFHGLNYRSEQTDCRSFYEYPMESLDILEKYGIDYVYISDYERAEFDVDMEAMSSIGPLVYENSNVRIYQVSRDKTDDQREIL